MPWLHYCVKPVIPFKILFIVSGTFLEKSGCFFFREKKTDVSDLLTPPLGIAYLAAEARRAGHLVSAVYIGAAGEIEKKLSGAMRNFKPDVLGVTCLAGDADFTARLFAAAKRINPRVFTVCGGPHATVRPELYLCCPHTDAVVRGEGELTLRCLLEALGDEARLHSVKGLSFKNAGGAQVHNPRRPLVRRINSLAPPALDIYADMDFTGGPYKDFRSGFSPILGARGCPFHCAMCGTHSIWQHIFRSHSPDRVVREMKTAADRFGVHSFMFLDEIFTLDRRRTLRLCEKIQRAGEGQYRWFCQTRADCVDAAVLRALKAAGCVYVNFGIESASDRLLRVIKKGMTVKQNLSAVRLARRAGLKVSASFMIGLPTETPAETRMTAKLAKSRDFDYTGIASFIPFEGCELAADSGRTGRFLRSRRTGDRRKIWVPHGHTAAKLEAVYREVNAVRMRPAAL